jgi:hypothetical protein
LLWWILKETEVTWTFIFNNSWLSSSLVLL